MKKRIHPTYFPLLVIVLSLLLFAVIFHVVREQSVTKLSDEVKVNVVEYQWSVRELTRNLPMLWSELQKEEQIVLLEQTQQGLLKLLVPAEYKELHLEMVVILSAWKSREDSVEERWQALVKQYDWLK